MSSSDVNNPMTVGTVSTEEEMKSSILETHRTSDIRESMSKRPSAAYLESMKKSGNRNADLEKKGIGTLDYEYRDQDDETESHIPIDFRNSTLYTMLCPADGSTHDACSRIPAVPQATKSSRPH